MADEALTNQPGRHRRSARPQAKPAKKAAAKATTKTGSTNQRTAATKKTVAKKASRPRKTPPAKPPRDGEVFEPAYLAHQLRLQGHTWTDCASTTGYANAVSCQLAVTAYLQKAALQMTRERAEEALQMELDMLDAMKQEWWNLGTRRHDEKAANILLKISAQRSRLLEHFAEDRDIVTGKTVVITGDGPSYVESLKRVIESGE